MTSFAISLLSLLLSRPIAHEPYRRRRGRSLLARPGRGANRSLSGRGPTARPQLELLEDRTLLSTYTVTNTGDNGDVNPAPGAGTGTLRQAIVDANYYATGRATSPDLIQFNIPTTDPHYISTTGAFVISLGHSSLPPQAYTLPPLTDTVFLDGYTQPGASPNTPKIVLDGYLAQLYGAPCLVIEAGNCTVRGLVIDNFLGGDESWGIKLSGSGHNTVEGNFIGTDPTGSLALGVFIYDSFVPGFFDSSNVGGIIIDSNCNTIAGNVIRSNYVAGVYVRAGTGNAILGNSIYENALIGYSVYRNGGLGIVLDSANNANNHQAAPVLTGMFNSSSGMTITGTLHSVADTTFRIEFFANTTPDPSGYGQGQTYLGSCLVRTDGNGNLLSSPDGSAIINNPSTNSASFTTSRSTPLPVGEGWVTATATATDSAGDTRDTSEFAQDVEVAPFAHVAANPSAAATADTVNLTLTATDPTPADQQAPFSYSINWGDGNQDSLSGSGSGMAASHTYMHDGVYAITVTATNQDRATGQAARALALVSTARGDQIYLSGGNSYPGQVSVAPSRLPPVTYSPTDLVYISGQGGSDTFTIDSGDVGLSTPVYISGQGGSDTYNVYFDPAVVPSTIPITIAGIATDTINAYGFFGSDNYFVKTPGQITWSPFDFSSAVETVTYSGPNVVLWGGTGVENYHNYFLDPGGNTAINGGSGANTVIITATTGNGVVINGGPTTNSYVINLGGLAGPVAINNRHTSATNSLTVNGAAADNSITASGSQVTVAGQAAIIVNAPLAGLTINGGSGSNQVTVSNLTVPVQSLTLNGAGTGNTFTLVNVGNIGSLAVNGGGSGSNQVQIQGAVPSNVQTENVSVLPPASLSGIAWEDFNDDGQVDFGENGIAGVPITLTGTTSFGQSVNLSQTTDSDGAYVFLNLWPGSYSIREAQPAGYQQGIDSVGTAGGSLAATDQFFVQLAAGDNGLNYNYGERPAVTGSVQKGQTAGIGFWNNKNGQALIRAFNGGTGTQLADWLAATLPHIFGVQAGSNNLAGKSNAYVAALFQQDFLLKGVKLDAQVLAAALSVYATNATLDSTGVAAQYGFVVSGNGVGTAAVNVGGNGDAFGVANNTTMTVMDLLLATDIQAVNGLLYGGSVAKRNDANNVYSAINQAGNIG